MLVAAASLFFNVISSVLLISINKVLLTTSGFVWANTLCGLHFVFTAVFSRFLKSVVLPTKMRYISFHHLAAFTFVSISSISSLTINLQINPVGFYQLSKLSTIAVTCTLERFLLKKRVGLMTLLAILVVLVGIGFTISSEWTVSTRGLLVAFLSVFSSSLQQIGVAQLQKEYSLTATELISQVFLLQALVLLIGGPLVDRVLWQSFPTSWNGFAFGGKLFGLLASCIAAIAVNFSQVICVKTLSPTGFQVLGNTKTVVILVAGWLFFDSAVPSSRVIGGQIVAILGMVLYGYSAQRANRGLLDLKVQLPDPIATKCPVNGPRQ